MKKKGPKPVDGNYAGTGDTSNFEVPDNVVKIQPGDTGFNLVKKNYNRFIWTWNEYANKKKKK